MSEEIDVKKVAKLARLKLTEEEEAYYKREFKTILKYVGKISEVEINSDMKEKDETLQEKYRSDKPQSSPVSPEQFSNNVENRFFKVPKIID